jgi:hypothetical protein
MPCDVVALNSAGACTPSEGGIQYSYYVSAEYVTAVTVATGVISTFTMSSAGKWKKLVPDADRTSSFNQTGERTNNRLRYVQALFLKFAGLSSVLKSTTDTAASCCQLIFVHVMTNGARIVQGIEIDSAATGGFTVNKLEPTKLTPSAISDTAENEARHEWNAGGITKSLAPYTTLTDSAIEAL